MKPLQPLIDNDHQLTTPRTVMTLKLQPRCPDAGGPPRGLPGASQGPPRGLPGASQGPPRGLPGAFQGLPGPFRGLLRGLPGASQGASQGPPRHLSDLPPKVSLPGLLAPFRGVPEPFKISGPSEAGQGLSAKPPSGASHNPPRPLRSSYVGQLTP